MGMQCTYSHEGDRCSNREGGYLVDGQDGGRDDETHVPLLRSMYLIQPASPETSRRAHRTRRARLQTRE